MRLRRRDGRSGTVERGFEGILTMRAKSKEGTTLDRSDGGGLVAAGDERWRYAPHLLHSAQHQ